MSEDTAKGEVVVEQKAEEDRQYFSVTTLLRAMGSQGLIEWSAQATAEAAVAHLGYLPTKLAHEGHAEVVRWLTDQRYASAPGRRSASELGTAVHRLCEQYALSGSVPWEQADEETLPFLEQFVRWVDDYQPSYEAAEMTVYNDAKGYAGTTDAVMALYGRRFIVDYKTSREDKNKWGRLREPYPDSVALQLAAYRHAEYVKPSPPRRLEQYRRRYYLLSPEERAACLPMPAVDAGLCVFITPERCDAYPITCDERVFNRFLHVAEVWRWQNQTSRNAMGEPLALYRPPNGGQPRYDDEEPPR